MRPKTLVLVVLLTIGSITVAPPAGSQSGADLVDACIDNGGSTQLCYGALRGNLNLVAGLCRDATSLDECAAIDGITVDEMLVAAQEKSWLNKALTLQRGLDDVRPLQDELWAHTHNSFNADVYPPTVSGLDRNQIYSIGDQLRMGSRAIEIDLHWAPSPEGDASDQFNAVLVCHGYNVVTDAKTIHVGCGLNDHVLPARLREIKDFLAANPKEVVMLYLQNELDGSPKAHELAAAELRKAFGSKVLTPASKCALLPMDTSRKQIRDSGARVIVTGNCGPGGWGALVHDQGPRWKESSTSYGDDFPAYPCTARRKTEDYAKNWIRHWGDETGLTAGSGGGGDVTSNDARNMVRCGVNMVGFDNLVPFDPRLAALVWSWAKNEPKRNGCATHGRDGRFRSSDCNSAPKPIACFDGANWKVTKRAALFINGTAACNAEKLGRFSVPRTGYENEGLKHAKSGVADVWLNYRSTSSGAWLS